MGKKLEEWLPWRRVGEVGPGARQGGGQGDFLGLWKFLYLDWE